jgi:hypothetical protein
MTWGSKPGERRGGRAKGTPSKRTAGIMAPPPSPAVVASVRALDELRFGAKLMRDLMIDAYDRLQQGKAKPDELIARIKDYLWAQEKVVPYEDAKAVSIKGGDGLDGSAPFEFTLKIGNVNADGSRTLAEARASPPVALPEAGSGDVLPEECEREGSAILAG